LFLFQFLFGTPDKKVYGRRRCVVPVVIAFTGDSKVISYKLGRQRSATPDNFVLKANPLSKEGASFTLTWEFLDPREYVECTFLIATQRAAADFDNVVQVNGALSGGVFIVGRSRQARSQVLDPILGVLMMAAVVGAVFSGATLGSAGFGYIDKRLGRMNLVAKYAAKGLVGMIIFFGRFDRFGGVWGHTVKFVPGASDVVVVTNRGERSMLKGAIPRTTENSSVLQAKRWGSIAFGDAAM
jgi:hypothetical protein